MILKNIFKSKKGFTLIELMMVIGIIGILAGIMVPKLDGIQDKAKNTAIASLASSMRTALEIYYAENNEYPDFGSESASGNEWEYLNQVLDALKLEEKSSYYLKEVKLADNGADLNKYLIKFISLDAANSDFFLGEKSFEKDNSENKASDLTIGI